MKKRNYEFITIQDYVEEINELKESKIISAIDYFENLKKELLPNEFAI